jgi:hypothetical protein
MLAFPDVGLARLAIAMMAGPLAQRGKALRA